MSRKEKKLQFFINVDDLRVVYAVVSVENDTTADRVCTSGFQSVNQC
jgi:hypothetical protein